ETVACLLPTDPIATVRLLKGGFDLVRAVPACLIPRLEPLVRDLIAGFQTEIMHENLREERGEIGQRWHRRRSSARCGAEADRGNVAIEAGEQRARILHAPEHVAAPEL